MTQSDPRIAFAILAGLFVLGLIVIFVVFPLLAQLGLFVEAGSLLLAAIGEYFGNPRLVFLGCLVGLLMCVGCCVIVVAVSGSLLTCGTATPSALCNLIRR